MTHPHPPDLYAAFTHQPTPWMEHAACKPHPTEWWFPKRGDPVDQAKIICHTCPVRIDCLNYALIIPNLVGIWGGMSGRERRDIRSTPKKPIRHGTRTGYHQHLRRGIEPCPACRKANTEHVQQQHNRRKHRDG